jgi:outer membrane protein
MKRSLALIATLASGIALSAAAQTTPAPAAAAPAGPAKIAVILFQATVRNTNEFQRNIADLQKKFAPQQAKLQELGEEIDTLTKQLQKQTNELSDTERANRAKVIDDKNKQAKRMLEDAQNDFQQEEAEMENGVSMKVYDVLVSYAQQQGYTMVLDGSQQAQQAIPVVLWASPPTDITKAIIEAYNVKSGVPAPPPPPPAATAPKPAAPAPKPAGAAPATH